MARLKGTSGNSKGEHFFDLLSDRPWVRIPRVCIFYTKNDIIIALEET